MAKRRVGRYPKAFKQMAVGRLNLRENIAAFIEQYYNRGRLHSALSYHSPE